MKENDEIKKSRKRKKEIQKTKINKIKETKKERKKERTKERTTETKEGRKKGRKEGGTE